MYSLSIAVTGVAQPWRLLFKTEAAAELAIEYLNDRSADITAKIIDDFGQIAVIHRYAGYLYEDMEASKHAAIELMLYNHRLQMEAQRKAQQTANGPAVITPNMTGVPFRQ